MGLVKFKKGFLDMSKLDIKTHAVVLVDKIYSNLPPQTNQIAQVQQINNPFEKVANQLALKGVFQKTVSQLQFGNNFHKEFVSDDFHITYDFLPPRLEIKDTNPQKNKENSVQKITLDIINFSEIEQDIGAIGINYEIFLEGKDIDLRKFLLKDDIQKGFTSLSATPIFKIDNNTTLNLTIAHATNKIDSKDGIFFGVNFHIVLDGNIKVKDIITKDYYAIAKTKIELIFKKIITE